MQVNFLAFQHIDPAFGHRNRDTERNLFNGFSLHLLKRMPVCCQNEKSIGCNRLLEMVESKPHVLKMNRFRGVNSVVYGHTASGSYTSDLASVAHCYP